MSHYAPYPAYKDSGVEWLGRVPEGWVVKRLKRNLKLLTEKADRKLRPVALENIESWTGRFIETESDFEGDGTEFEQFDILFGKLRPYLAKVYLATSPGEAVGDFFVLRPNPSMHGAFVTFQLLSREFINHVDGSTYGAKMPRVSWDFFGEVTLPTPPLAEQRAITAHLDRETVRLDGLVAKKTRFIELLREKRQALITHAVTKGLDPTVKMKDSGVEWLGQVPGHWDVTVLKYVVATIEQGWSPECEARPVEENEWGVLKVGCVNSGVFNDQQNKALPPDLKPEPSLALRAGDVLVSRANTRDLVGSCAVLERDFPFLMICDKLYRLRVNARVIPNFLGLMIRVYGRRDIEVEANGASSSMVNIAQSVIMNLRVNVPPVAEQTEIVAQVGHATTRLDTLIEKTERSIALIKERRAALITAAVTGQIDLRAAA